MGTRERKARAFEAREQLLLDTARRLILRDGLLNLQMARLAEASEHATGTLYQHFTSKEDLLLALATETVTAQAALFQRAAAWQAPTRDRMFAITVADMLFVHRNPEHFRVQQYATSEVVWDAASADRRQAHLTASQPVSAAVLGIVREALAGGDLPSGDLSPEAVATGCWSLTLGMHHLAHVDGLLAHFNVHDPCRLLCRHMQHLLNGLGWQPLFDPDDASHFDDLISRIRTEVFDELCTPA